MAVKIHSCTTIGIETKLIEVEADIQAGLSCFTIVGLGDTAIQEAKERIRSAIKNSHAGYPQNKKIINLAPANIKKHGPHFDLPMALSLLIASGQLPADKFENAITIGELALDGSVRPVRSTLIASMFCLKNNWKTLYIPKENYCEARLALDLMGNSNLQIIPVSHLSDFLQPEFAAPKILCQSNEPSEKQSSSVDFSEIEGNENAKRALVIAAAGGHHIAMKGSPGVGKTMLAKSLPSILPPLSAEEIIEVTQVYSAAGLLETDDTYNKRPFREVHHTCTEIALTGGGPNLKPGEISLAHNGVLFMDELPEFPRKTIECLRQPLEEKTINISRLHGTIKFPANFMLVAGMNPCPCGYFGDREKACACSPHQIMQYQKRISGPILDRIDLIVNVERTPLTGLTTSNSKDIRDLILQARKIQKERYKYHNIHTNSQLSGNMIRQFCSLNAATTKFLNSANNRYKLSGRQQTQIIKISRTIADLGKSAEITLDHIAEALGFIQFKL